MAKLIVAVRNFAKAPKKRHRFSVLARRTIYANIELGADFIWTLSLLTVKSKKSLPNTHQFKSLENLLFIALFVSFLVGVES
jgi:hypothetical protein